MNRSDFISNGLFWLVLCSFAVLQFSSPIFIHSMTSFGIFIGLNFTYVILFYLHYIVLIPKILMGNYKYKSILYLAVFLISIAITAFTKTTLFIGLKSFVITPHNDFIDAKLSLITTTFSAGFVSVSSLLLKFTSDWFTNEKNRLQKELEHKEMEVSFLRSQLNPHFLFNVLNNMYALAVQQSERTPEVIIKLSDMMRYILYESNETYVDLATELDYLNNYIELQKLRYHDHVCIDFEIQGIVHQQKIIPLLLISFVENVFKHGVLTDAAFPASIEVICNPQVLHLTVKNKKNNSQKDHVGGVGMANVERRLELMYPQKYTFNVINTEQVYASELIIQL